MFQPFRPHVLCVEGLQPSAVYMGTSLSEDKPGARARIFHTKVACRADEMPVTRGYVRALYPLLYGPSPRLRGTRQWPVKESSVF